MSQTTPVLEGISPVLTVHDMDAALGFYVSQLGFELIWQWGDPIKRAGVGRDGFEIHLMCDPELEGTPPAVVYCHMRGVASYFEDCVRRGTPIHKPLDDRAWGMKDFSVVDPTGNHLGFGEADTLSA